MKKYCLIWSCKGLVKTYSCSFIMAKDEEEAKAVADKYIKSHLTIQIYKHYKCKIEELVEITDDKFYTMEKVDEVIEQTEKFMEDFLNSKENENGENP